MHNIKFLKTLTAGVALTMALYPQAGAFVWSTKTCDDPNGHACYRCGNNCTATLYLDGKLVVSGTSIGGGGDTNNTFSNSSVQPTSLIIEEGITTIGGNALWGVESINSVSLPNSLTSIGGDGLGIGTISQLTIGPNTIISSLYSAYPPYYSSNLRLICRGDVGNCRENNQAYISSRGGVNAVYTDEVRDANGKLQLKYNANGYYTYDENENIVEGWNFAGTEKYDAKGNIIAKYDNEGNLLETNFYKYDGAGNITAAYKNGIVTYKRTSYTPVEAAAAVKKGNKNTITFTFK